MLLGRKSRSAWKPPMHRGERQCKGGGRAAKGSDLPGKAVEWQREAVQRRWKDSERQCKGGGRAARGSAKAVEGQREAVSYLEAPDAGRPALEQAEPLDGLTVDMPAAINGH